MIYDLINALHLFEVFKRMNNRQGVVFWLTGLSGSGKTTIGTELTHRLRAQNLPVMFLDGDHLREITGNSFGHDREQRLQASLLYARLCNMIAAQKIHVVCATISLFHQTQQWNRDNIKNYLEIFIDVPLPELIKRDPKKIYSRAQSGELKNVVGIDIPAEFPLHPDLTIQNYDSIDINQAVETILKLNNSIFSHKSENLSKEIHL